MNKNYEKRLLRTLNGQTSDSPNSNANVSYFTLLLLFIK